MNRRAFLAGLLALTAAGGIDAAEARPRGPRRRVRGFAGGLQGRGTTDDGNCPCNGGKVCTGKRGGRYCITSSGRKRYGV